MLGIFLSKVWLLQNWFSWNSQLLKGIMWRSPIMNFTHRGHAYGKYGQCAVKGATWWCSCLRHCTTSRKVAGIPGICHWHNPSSRAIALGSAQPLTEVSRRNNSWGWRQLVHRTDNLTTFMSWMSKNSGSLNLLTGRQTDRQTDTESSCKVFLFQYIKMPKKKNRGFWVHHALCACLWASKWASEWVSY